MGATKLEFLNLREEEIQNEEQGLSFELKSLLQADKAHISELSKHLVDKVATGDLDPFKAYIHNKKILELATSNEKNLRPYVNSKGVPKTGLTMYNVEFTAKSDASKYDYTVCEDKEWNELQNKLTALKKEITEREAFLKALKKDIELVDIDSGETYTIHPPIKTSGAENFSSTIK